MAISQFMLDCLTNYSNDGSVTYQGYECSTKNFTNEIVHIVFVLHQTFCHKWALDWVLGTAGTEIRLYKFDLLFFLGAEAVS